MPVSAGSARYIMTQHVPKKLGNASYPLHVFPNNWLANELGVRYDLLTQFPTLDAAIRSGRVIANYVGSIWILKQQGPV